MNYIKVWCEYDISGTFGGNNNEEVLRVPEDYESNQIEPVVEDYLHKITGLRKDELEGLWDWEFIVIEDLVL